MRALLDMPGVTQSAVAGRIGVDRCMVSRWLHAERALRLSDALFLVERWGGRPLVEAGRAVGLTLSVSEDAGGEVLEGDTEDLRVELLGGLSAEVAQLAAELLSAPETPDGRAVLIGRVRRIEELCQRVQQRLLSAG